MSAARIVVVAVLVVGLAGSVFALEDRGVNAEFAYQQQSLAPLNPDQLAVLLETTSDPRPGSSHGRAVSASCRALGHGTLRNPWACSVRYPVSREYARAHSVDFRVVIAPSGTIKGIAPGRLSVHGCCVATSGAP